MKVDPRTIKFILDLLSAMLHAASGVIASDLLAKSLDTPNQV